MKWTHVLLAALLVGCGGASGTITIGAAGPWQAGYGAMNLRGIELAVEEINGRGGVRGRPLILRSEDDQGDGARAAAIADGFVGDPEVLAVVGHVNSGAMVAAARVYDGVLPAIATTATSPDITGISPWVFRVISSDSTNGITLARFANRLELQRVAILYENNSYGRGLADAFRRNFSGDILSIDPIAEDGSGIEPHISWYRQERPDLVFVAGTEESGIAIMREARRQRIDAAFLGGDGWSGVLGAGRDAEGVYVGQPFTTSDPRPEAQAFVQAFRERYRMEPDANAALAYDATMMLARAIERGGPNRRAIRDELAASRVRDMYAGVTGPIRFNGDGDPIGKAFVMTQIRNGTFVVAGDRQP